MEQKLCTKCGISKSISEFFKDKQKSTGYRPDCKECNIKRSTQWQKNNKEKHYGYEIKRRYGITIEQYNNLLKVQNYKCAICNRHISKFKTRFHIDHSHKNKVIRELLCVNCNHGIGAFFEDIKLLNKAIKYIKKHEPKNSSHK